LLLLLVAPADQRTAGLWFSILTLLVGGSLYFVHGQGSAAEGNATAYNATPVPSRQD
jgi:hypothetical protein